MKTISLKDSFSDWRKDMSLSLFSSVFSILSMTSIVFLFVVWSIKKITATLALVPLAVFSFVLWSDKTKEKLICLGIFLFPCIKIFYLGYNLLKHGRITKRKANALYLFVTLVFLGLFAAFAGKAISLNEIDQTTSFIIYPAIMGALLFAMFEIAKIVGFNMIDEDFIQKYQDEKAEAEKRLHEERLQRSLKEAPVKVKARKNIRADIEQLKLYGRNIAGHLPMGAKDDLPE